MLDQTNQKKLENLMETLKGEEQRFIGYPCNNDFDYSPLYPFLSMSLNNVGDPFSTSTYRLNTMDIEKEVIKTFAKWTKAPEDNFWGYVTNGGTEGNIYGIFLARELYPDGIVYYSQDTHYSVSKLLKLLRVKSIMIRSNDDGTMDLEDLKATLQINRHAPPIICANIGTTMTGAIDDLAGIKALITEMAFPNHYIHCDCALSGMILPFLEDPQAFNFADGCHSMSVSGHKFIGSPIPCGIVLAQKNNVDRIARAVEYVGSLDTTITGSRDGLTPLFLWYAFKSLGKEGLKKRVEQCLKMAAYGEAAMKAKGIPAWRHKNSITVVFPRPHQEVINKWSLAVENDTAHFITMHHVTEDMIDRFIDDVIAHQGDSQCAK